MNTTIDMTAIVAKSEELGNDLIVVNRELKRLASVKCRLKKAPGRLTYQEEMTKCLQEEQLLKNVKGYLSEPRKTVVLLTAADVENMNIDEVEKALHCIRSKKTHTKWAEDCERDAEGLYLPGTGAQYREACRIEQMLLDRKGMLKPLGNTRISKASLLELIDNMKLCSDLTLDDCFARLEEFINN